MTCPSLWGPTEPDSTKYLDRGSFWGRGWGVSGSLLFPLPLRPARSSGRQEAHPCDPSRVSQAQLALRVIRHSQAPAQLIKNRERGSSFCRPHGAASGWLLTADPAAHGSSFLSNGTGCLPVPRLQRAPCGLGACLPAFSPAQHGPLQPADGSSLSSSAFQINASVKRESRAEELWCLAYHIKSWLVRFQCSFLLAPLGRQSATAPELRALPLVRL